MARFHSVVGFSDGTVQTSPGIWQDHIVEKQYFGDVIRNSRQFREGENLNNDLSVENSIEIVADAYANLHFHAIRYVMWAGALWNVYEVEVRSPRLVLRLGGVYNGPRAETSAPSSPGSPSGE